MHEGKSHNFGSSKLGLESKVSPSLLNIAWAAGIYEGEGTANGAHIGVSQKNKALLIVLKNLFGGTISPMGSRPIYQWHISGTRAREFAMTIYRFLTPHRQEQIKKVWTK